VRRRAAVPGQIVFPLGAGGTFRNPFGNQHLDGTDSAGFMTGLGNAVRGALAVLSSGHA
jgi:hypothetical protein